MFCSQCGTEISKVQKFCTNCGYQLKSNGLSLNEGYSTTYKNKNLIEAFKRRQKDKSWGFAIAHLIPFVSIFYAFSRRTITPIIIAIAVNASMGFCVGFLFYLEDDETLSNIVTMLSLITTPLSVKYGISKARNYAKKRLDEII